MTWHPNQRRCFVWISLCHIWYVISTAVPAFHRSISPVLWLLQLLSIPHLTQGENGQLESIEGYVWLCIQASHAAKWLACEQVGEWQCHRKPPKQWYKTGSSLLSENTFRTFVEAVGLVPCLPRTRSWPDIHRPLIELNDHDLDCACQAHVSSVSGEKEMQTKMQDLKDPVSRLNG